MAYKLSRARRIAMGIQITPQQGCWIKYQLDLHHITQTDVARKAGCTPEMITQFLKGRKNSEKVKTILAEVLGYRDFSVLVAVARGKAA